jgi:hypothetical protein
VRGDVTQAAWLHSCVVGNIWPNKGFGGIKARLPKI